MSLPIRVFWLMSGSIGRLLAETDLRALTVSAAASSEGASEVRNNLIIEMGMVGEREEDKLQEKRDEEGFKELKALSALM